MTRQSRPDGQPAWEHAVRDIPAAGLSREREATADELAGIARALDLVACRSLRAAYTLKPGIGGRCHLAGSLRAEITQTCVVTLEPVESTVAEAFDVTFWPQEAMPAPRGGAVDIEEEPEPEPIVAGHVDVGRVVFECLAAAINPFPRQEGARLDWQAPASATAAATPDNPFAVLANIKTKA